MTVQCGFCDEISMCMETVRIGVVVFNVTIDLSTGKHHYKLRITSENLDLYL